MSEQTKAAGEARPVSSADATTSAASAAPPPTVDPSAANDSSRAKDVSQSAAGTPSPASAQSVSGAQAAPVARAVAEWRVVGETVPGASHLRAGIPNQDALLHLRASSVGLPVVLAVSDGHGSDKCFRSDRGSRMGVHLAVELLSETLNKVYNGEQDAGDLARFEAEERARLPAEVVARWRAAVEADFKREPFTEAEMTRMIERDGERARSLVEADPHLAYGATLLAVALTERFAIYMQLGDGEIIAVSDKGEVASPLPDDERLLANETTSLCLRRAAEDFRFAVRAVDTPPAIVLLTTDGYYNSFSTTEGFRQVGKDLLDMIRADGFDSVNRGVKGWLEEATRAGSGDDCTLLFAVRMDALASATPAGSASPDVAQAALPTPANA